MNRHKLTNLFHWMKRHELSKKGLKLYFVLVSKAGNNKRIDISQKQITTLCGFSDKLDLVKATNELIFNNLASVSWNTGGKNKVAYPVYTLLDFGEWRR